MSSLQVISTTDGKFIGFIFNPDEPIILSGFLFIPDKVQHQAGGVIRLSNSNYVIDAKEF